MQQLTFLRKGILEWRDVPEPTLQTPDDVLVRPIAVARCDADRLFLFNDASRLLSAGLALHFVDQAVPEYWGHNPPLCCPRMRACW